MNLAAFFNAVRKDPRLGAKSLTQTQVDVASLIIEKGQGLRLDALAYVLGTAWGEAKFTPQRENMSYSAARMRQVWPRRFPTLASAKPYERQPQKLANYVYGGRNGNTEPNDGWLYRGGGLDQLTGKTNYVKRGLAANPDAILQPEAAARSLITGMTLGDYRGPKLADFFTASGSDFESARAIVNADVKAHGKKYADYARAFRDALKAAGYGDTPVLDAVRPTPKPSSGSALQPAGSGWLGTLIAAIIRAVFGGKK